jgi:hypothetical protein
MFSTTGAVIFTIALAEGLAPHQPALGRDPRCRELEPGTLSSVSSLQRFNGCIALLGACMIRGEPALVLLSNISCNTVHRLDAQRQRINDNLM